MRLQGSSAAYVTTADELAASHLVRDHLVASTEPQALSSIVKASPDLKAYLMSAPIRLVALLQLFPDQFTLSPATSMDGLLVSLAVDDRQPVKLSHGPAKGQADDAFLNLLVTKMLHHQRSGNPTDPVPTQWIVRTMGSHLEMMVACAREPALLFHLDPSRHGYTTRWAAWWGSVDAHLKRFIELHPQDFTWHESNDGSEPVSISLSPLAVQRHVREREVERALQRQRRQQRAGASTSSSVTTTTTTSDQQNRASAGSGATATRSEAIDASALRRACEAGDHTVIVMRGAARTAAVFEEELQAAAEHVQLPEGALKRFGPSVWILSPEDHEARLLVEDIMPRLACARSVGTPILVAESPAAMVSELCMKPDDLRRRVFASDGALEAESRWSLRVEALFPSTDPRMLPFHALDAVPELCVALHGALGGSFVASSDAGCGEVELVLLQTKQSLLLVRDSSPDVDDENTTPTAADDSGMVSASRAVRLPPWIGRWERRDFAFSSSLDPMVAIAACNLAAFAHHSGSNNGMAGLRVFDPCVGSGTVLAAAASLGCADLVGSDLRRDFVVCAELNLEYHLEGMGANPKPSVVFHVQDATASLAAPLVTSDWSSTIVVCNPPWGKNTKGKKGEGDGVDIVRSITAQCTGATFCWIANSRTTQALNEMPEVAILRRIPFGAVEIVVCQVEEELKETDTAACDDKDGVHQASLMDLGLRSTKLSSSKPARVLVCGDADFAYSEALVSALSCDSEAVGVHLYATCYETEEMLLDRYPHAASTIAALRQRGNVAEVLFGIDCRNISAHFGEGATFDRIVFNLPQAPVVPGARNKIQRHRALLADFCASAEAALAPHGQLWVTLLAGQGGTCLDSVRRPLGDSWQIQQAGASANLLVRAAKHVDQETLGYVPTGRRANQRITPTRLARGLVVHVLSREGEPAEPAACGALEWCFQNSFHCEDASQTPPDPLALFEAARDTLDETTVHSLVVPPELLSERDLGAGERAWTYLFTYRSAQLALSRERVQRANAAACRHLALVTKLQWTLGYPVRRPLRNSTGDLG